VDAEGINQVVDRIVTLTEIRLHYRLTIPAGTRDLVDRALAGHQEKCPTAVSLRGAVSIAWDAEIQETGDPGWFTPRS
jgi:uncharacterized OsmC-like protein